MDGKAETSEYLRTEDAELCNAASQLENTLRESPISVGQ
jgi:hypothetical protein